MPPDFLRRKVFVVTFGNWDRWFLKLSSAVTERNALLSKIELSAG
jgi:hypothetical protein